MKTLTAKNIRELTIEDLKEVFDGQMWESVENYEEFRVLNLNHGYVYIQFNLATEDYGEIDFVRTEVSAYNIINAITGVQYDENIYNYLYKDEGNYTEEVERIERLKEEKSYRDIYREEQDLNKRLDDLYHNWMEMYFEDYFTDEYADKDYNNILEVLRGEIIEIIDEYVDAGWIEEDEEILID